MAFDPKQYYQQNREAIIARNSRYQTEHRKQATANKRERYQRLRQQAMLALGNRCSSPTCRWLNEDGTMGCDRIDILQIDHVKGNGHKELKPGNPEYIGSEGVLKRIINGETADYQLLCPTCNWIKRVVANETYFAIPR